MPDAAAALLVVGDSSVGKRSLVAGLPGISAALDSLALDTKYYTATAAVQLRGGSAPPPSEEQAGNCEALVLVFDATREATFQYVQQWAASDRAEIRLCVAAQADRLLRGGQLARPAWLEAAREWCTAELLEYVEVAATSPEVDAALELNGEAQGLGRVAAALHAHTWPGLTLKAPAAGSSARPGQSGREPSDSSSAAEPPAQPSGGPEQPQPANGAAHARGEGNGCAAMESRGNGHAAGVATDEQLEAEMEGFESLMREVQGARGRLAGLPDAERRSAAEALTLRLMSQFGIADESGSDSDA